MFEHFIITRFNLKKEGWNTSKYNIPVLTSEWLLRRFELFQNFCFPSVKNQINQNFTWLVYFDVSTPQEFKELVFTLSNEYQGFKPKFVDGMENFLPAIQNELKNSKADFIISSRIDNDDCIAENYIAEVQKRFRSEKHWAIDFADGYTLQISPDHKLGRKRQLWNPFISLIEKNENPKSVWQKSHADWKIDPLVERVNNNRVWMSVIHQENKVNEFTGYGNVSANVLHSFKMNPAKREEIVGKLRPNSQWPVLNFRNFADTHFKCIYKDIKRAIRLRSK